jgi:hypothetical protein
MHTHSYTYMYSYAPSLVGSVSLAVRDLYVKGYKDPKGKRIAREYMYVCMYVKGYKDPKGERIARECTYVCMYVSMYVKGYRGKNSA